MTPPAAAHLFVRRIADKPGRWRRARACYEVGTFPRGGLVPISVRRTTRPDSVLVHEGVHTTDVRDYVRNADRSWRGGVGPWRGLYPDVGPS